MPADIPPGEGNEQQTPPPATGGEQDSAAAARLAQLEQELNDARTTLQRQEAERQEADRLAAIEQGKFKELYEAEVQKRAAIEAEQAKTARDQAMAKAATDAGLPAEMAARLVGSTPEELAADAKRLAELLRVPPPATGSTNPGAQRQQQQAAFDPKNPPKLSQIQWKK